VQQPTFFSEQPDPVEGSRQRAPFPGKERMTEIKKIPRPLFLWRGRFSNASYAVSTLKGAWRAYFDSISSQTMGPAVESNLREKPSSARLQAGMMNDG